jgi:hypothetical protein
MGKLRVVGKLSPIHPKHSGKSNVKKNCKKFKVKLKITTTPENSQCDEAEDEKGEIWLEGLHEDNDSNVGTGTYFPILILSLS